MTIQEIIEKANELMSADDYTFDEDFGINAFSDNKKYYSLTFHDFIGFSEDWDEEYRNFTNEIGIERFLAWLTEKAITVEDHLYHDYHFEDFFVSVGYDSFDI